jgi:hypothetical protein
MQLDKLAPAIFAMGVTAHRLADDLQRHKHGTDHQTHAALHRIEVALRDFANAIRDAEAALSPAVRAAIGAR